MSKKDITVNIFPVPDAWTKDALCINYDPEMWHFEPDQDAYARRARIRACADAVEICLECPVRVQCLKTGLARDNIKSERDGRGASIWGGLTDDERSSMVDPKYKGYTGRFTPNLRAELKKRGIVDKGILRTKIEVLKDEVFS